MQKVEFHGLSDRGARPENQDQFLIAELSKSLLVRQTSLSETDHSRLLGRTQGALFVVADGMGGMGGGGVASTVAVTTLTQYFLNVMPWFFGLAEAHADELRSVLGRALARCAEEVRRASQAPGAHAQMGTTLTMAYLLWPRVFVVHVGDTRCYLFRPPDLKPVTRDHTVARKLADEHVLSEEQAARSSWRDVLWQAVGGGTEELQPEVYGLSLQEGDSLLLCTDGLSKEVEDDEIAAELASGAPASEICGRLVGRATASDKSDNVTVVVVRFPRA